MNYSVQFVNGHIISPALPNTMCAKDLHWRDYSIDYFFNLVKENSHTNVLLGQHLKQKIIKLLKKIGSFSTG